MNRKRHYLPTAEEGGPDSWFFLNYYRKAPFAFFNNENPLRAIVVSGSGTYRLPNINGKSTNEIYDMLIREAKKELKLKGMYADIDVTTDPSKEKEAKNAVEQAMLDIAKGIKKELGETFNTSTISDLNYDFKNGSLEKGTRISKRTNQKVEYVKAIKELEREAYGEFLAAKFFEGSVHSPDFILAAIKGKDPNKRGSDDLMKQANKHFEKLKRDLASKQISKQSGQEATTVGFLNETLSIWAMRQVESVTSAIPGGTKRVKVTDRKGNPIVYPTASGKQRTYTATTTTDAQVEIKGQDGQYNLSIKMGQSPFVTKYKEFEGAKDPLTHIAEWSHLTRTYIGWGAYNGIIKETLGDYIATTFASVALGGFKEDRALYLLKSSGKVISIQSIDVALANMKTTAPLRMTGFKVQEFQDLIENLQTLASATNIVGARDQSKIYSANSLLKEINFNYKLETTGPYKSVLG